MRTMVAPTHWAVSRMQASPLEPGMRLHTQESVGEMNLGAGWGVISKNLPNQAVCLEKRQDASFWTSIYGLYY